MVLEIYQYLKLYILVHKHCILSRYTEYDSHVDKSLALIHINPCRVGEVFEAPPLRIFADTNRLMCNMTFPIRSWP